MQNNPYLNPVPVPVPPPPPPPAAPAAMLVYPHHLYSTVNQNQIHLHVHHTDLNKSVEQYTNVASVVGSITAAEAEPEQNDSVSVWRPY